ETLLLAVFGTVAGLLAAGVVAGTLRSLFVDSTESWSVIGDARTLAFAVGVTLVVAVLTGILPALRVAREDLASSLKAGMHDSAYRRSSVRSALVVVQTGLCVVLLVGAGLFVRSLREVRALRLGYDADSLVFVSTAMRCVKLTQDEQLQLA